MKKNITYDELLAQISNKYILTITAGKRARDLGKGAPILTKVSKKDTIIKKTFREILDGKISFTNESDEFENEE